MAERERWSRSPDPTPLYGAAKLVGTIGARTTVGLISALTGPNDVEVDTDGRRARAAAAGSVDDVQHRAPQAQAGARTPRSACWRRRPTASRRRLPVGALCPVTGRADRPPTGAAPTTPTCSAPTGAGARALGNYAVAWQAVGTTLQNGPTAHAARRHPDPPGPRRGAAARSTSARTAARTGCGAPGSTSRARCWSSTTSATWNARTTTRRYLTLAYRTLEPWWITRETRTRAAGQRARDAGRPQPVERDQAGDARAASPTSGRSTSTSTRAALLRRSRDRRRHGAASARPSAGVSGERRNRSAAAADVLAVGDVRPAARRRRHLRRQRHVSLRALSRLELALLPDRRLRERRAPLRREGRRCRRRMRRAPTSSARRRRPASARRCAPPTPSRPSCRCSCTRSCSWRASTTARYFTVTQPRRRGASASPTCGRADRRADAADTETRDAEHQRRAALGVPPRLDAVRRLHARTESRR